MECAGEEQASIVSGRGFENKRYHKRSKERIIRFVHYKQHDDPEAYYREQLLLYYPWSAATNQPLALSTDEDSYLLDGHDTFESKFSSVESVIAENRKRYDFNARLDWDEIQRTARELEEADESLL